MTLPPLTEIEWMSIYDGDSQYKALISSWVRFLIQHVGVKWRNVAFSFFGRYVLMLAFTDLSLEQVA